MDSTGLAWDPTAERRAQVCDAAAGAAPDIIFAHAGLRVAAAAADAAVGAAIDPVQHPASSSLVASLDLAQARIPQSLGARVAPGPGFLEEGEESDEEEYEQEDDAEEENCAGFGE